MQSTNCIGNFVAILTLVSIIQPSQTLHAVSAETATHIWGNLCYLKQQQVRYTQGKITAEELSNRNQRCLRKMMRLANAARSHDVDIMRELNLRMEPEKRSSRRASR